MKIKKVVLLFILTACMAIAMITGGCAAKYTVTVNNVNSNKSYVLTLSKGEKITMDTLIDKYRDEFLTDTGLYIDENLYADEACLVKFVNGIDGNTDLYFGEYDPQTYGRVVFVYGGERYTVYRTIGVTLTASDFSLSAYGFGAPSDYVFYSDEAHTSFLSIDGVSVTGVLSGDTVVYVADAV